ncbi:ribonuclease P [Candidatus Woesearchaeota archaeon]|nr:ribonuclease P [Candidatus Woesearchaeota archaeon]
MKSPHQKKPGEVVRIAQEHITVLFEQAQKMFSEHPELSNRHVKLARKIAMRFKIKLPKQYQRMFCKHCYAFFMPSKTCRVRTEKGKIVYYCFTCKKYTRWMYK